MVCVGLSYQRSSSKQNAVPLSLLHMLQKDLAGIHGMQNEGVIAKLLIVSSFSFIKGWQIMTDNGIYSFCPIHLSEAWPGWPALSSLFFFFPSPFNFHAGQWKARLTLSRLDGNASHNAQAVSSRFSSGLNASSGGCCLWGCRPGNANLHPASSTTEAALVKISHFLQQSLM